MKANNHPRVDCKLDFNGAEASSSLWTVQLLFHFSKKLVAVQLAVIVQGPRIQAHPAVPPRCRALILLSQQH